MKELHVTKDALRDKLLGELEIRFITKEPGVHYQLA